MFRRVLREVGCSGPRRWCMWAAVRAGNGMADATARDWWQVALVAFCAWPIVVPLLIVAPVALLFRLLERCWP